MRKLAPFFYLIGKLLSDNNNCNSKGIVCFSEYDIKKTHCKCVMSCIFKTTVSNFSSYLFLEYREVEVKIFLRISHTNKKLRGDAFNTTYLLSQMKNKENQYPLSTYFVCNKWCDISPKGSFRNSEYSVMISGFSCDFRRILCASSA